MNPLIVLAAALAVASVSTVSWAAPAQQSKACEPQSEKPAPDNKIIEVGDDWETRFSKAFSGYLQKEINGKTLYLPLNMTSLSSYDHGDSIHDVPQPHYLNEFITTDCGIINLGITKMRPRKDIIYTFNYMTYNFGGQTEHCKLVKAEAKEGTHVYDCLTIEDKKKIATLIINRMDLEKVVYHSYPTNYSITWL